MKYMAIIDADEKPVSCEFIGCNGNVTPYLIGATTNIKELEQEPKTGHWILGGYDEYYYICDRCKFVASEYYTKPKFHYCSNCGAKMVDSQESEGV